MEDTQLPEPPLFALPAVGWRLFGCYWLGDEGSVITSWANKWSYWSIIGEERAKLHYVGDEAECRARVVRHPLAPPIASSHVAPVLDHGCGFYAYHTLTDLRKGPIPGGARSLEKVMDNYVWSLSPAENWSLTPYIPTAPIVALVQGHGRGVVHDTTYRSQKMRIAALCSDGLHTTKIAKAHAEKLDIPALSLTEMREYSQYAGVCLRDLPTTEEGQL